VVFSPSGARVLISDRVFSENPEYPSAALVHELSELLEAEVLIIPSLKSDMTGHADGMARFLDDRTVLCNRPLSSCGFEQQVKRAVQDCGLDAVDFPFVPTGRVSAVGCYLNYLETERVVFLPVFGIEQDAEAETSVRQLFSKEIVPVNIREIAQQGGCLNCISWEGPHA
jgi:agmatine deiminase